MLVKATKCTAMEPELPTTAHEPPAAAWAAVTASDRLVLLELVGSVEVCTDPSMRRGVSAMLCPSFGSNAARSAPATRFKWPEV